MIGFVVFEFINFVCNSAISFCKSFRLASNFTPSSSFFALFEPFKRFWILATSLFNSSIVEYSFTGIFIASPLDSMFLEIFSMSFAIS